MLESDLLSCVELIYESALEPALRKNALTDVSRLTGAVSTAVVPTHGLPPDFLQTSLGRDDSMAAYKSYWIDHDLMRSRRLERHLLSGSYWDSDIVTSEQMATSPFFQEFMPSSDVSRVNIFAVNPSPGVAFSINTQRPLRTPFETTEQRRLRVMLSRHLSRAMTISAQLQEISSVTTALAEAVERLRCGVVVLESSGRVLFFNQAARDMLGDGIEIEHGVLMPSSRHERGDLDRLVATVLSVSLLPPSTDVVPLTRPSGRRPLYARAIPIPSTSRWRQGDTTTRASAAVILLVDLDADSAQAEDALKAAFRALGLTPAEARLAAEIGGGASPADAAVKLRIGLETARKSLKTIYQKLAINRQSQLARLLSRLEIFED